MICGPHSLLKTHVVPAKTVAEDQCPMLKGIIFFCKLLKPLFSVKIFCRANFLKLGCATQFGGESYEDNFEFNRF